MPELNITVHVNGRPIAVERGATAAAALARSGVTAFRTSVLGEPRGPLCGMGICFECRVTINELPHQRACLRSCEEGMELRTDD